MKRKIVVKESMTCDEYRRSKALQPVSRVKGLISVAIEGPEKDRVVVVGEDIDTVWLLDKLRKKVGNGDIVTVQEIKPPVMIKTRFSIVNLLSPSVLHPIHPIRTSDTPYATPTLRASSCDPSPSPSPS